ncbi:glycosyltransferase [Candidatus Omnitrophota bacterium]
MKLLLLATTYEYGGVSSVIKNISDNLDRGKFDITLMVEKMGVRHYPLKDDIKVVTVENSPARGLMRKFINIFGHLSDIRRAVIKEKPDIVLGFGFSINCMYVLPFVRSSKVKSRLILAEFTEELFVKHGSKTFKGHVLKYFYKLIMFLFYRYADAIIAVSGSLAKHIERSFLIDKKKIHVIHVPVNIEEIRARSQEKAFNGTNGLACVGTVSRLSAEKGIDDLIKAFANLTKDMDASLIVVGDGEERDNLKSLAKGLGIEDKVNFLGWIENPYSYIKKMDVFVLSSLWEGFPNVVIESMACGVPVVATNSVGGVSEAIRHGIDGLLTAPKNIKALSDSIYSLLKDKELRDRLIHEANKKIERFDASNITREYEAVLLNLK